MKQQVLNHLNKKLEKKDRVEEDYKKVPVPIEGEDIWEREKIPTRSSSRVARKPNWLGNSVMVEQESSAGESVHSVYETEAPQRNQEF